MTRCEYIYQCMDDAHALMQEARARNDIYMARFWYNVYRFRKTELEGKTVEWLRREA